jgi:SH3-like domain-containing protein
MLKRIYCKEILIIFFSLFFFSNTFAEDVFLSLKKNKVNVRYGPSFESPIKFIYKKINLPIKQIDKKENWRRIVDLKNNGGWIHSSQLKPINSIIPINDKILFNKPSKFSKPLAKVQKGRVLLLEKCEAQWCKVKTDKFKGWINEDNIWGLIK